MEETDKRLIMQRLMTEDIGKRRAYMHDRIRAFKESQFLAAYEQKWKKQKLKRHQKEQHYTALRAHLLAQIEQPAKQTLSRTIFRTANIAPEETCVADDSPPKVQCLCFGEPRSLKSCRNCAKARHREVSKASRLKKAKAVE